MSFVYTQLCTKCLVYIKMNAAPILIVNYIFKTTDI
jgi:hypothetical protein